MTLDIAFLILLAFGFIRGFMKGLVLSVFSFIALGAGIVCALKFSHLAAVLFEDLGMRGSWVPVASFVAVFIAVLIAVTLISRLLDKIVNIAMLGLLNKVAGGVFSMALFALVASSLLWFADQINLVSQETRDHSHLYGIIQPLAPITIDMVGAIIPGIEDTLQGLEEYFNGFIPDSTQNPLPQTKL